MIIKPTLPPKAGYVEVETGSGRTYQNVKTGELIENEVKVPVSTMSVWDELDAAYREGVNSV